MKPLLIIGCLLFCLFEKSWGQPELASCQAIRQGDTLILGNSLNQRTYLFKDGNLTSLSITDKRTGKKWVMGSLGPDFALPVKTGDPASGDFTVKAMAETGLSPAHLEAEVMVALGTL